MHFLQHELKDITVLIDRSNGDFKVCMQANLFFDAVLVSGGV